MNKSIKILLVVLAAVVIIGAAVSVGLDRRALEEQTLDAIIDEEFGDVQYAIENKENYKGYQKVELVVNGEYNSSIPMNKATLFIKDGQIQNIPDEYLKDIIEPQKESFEDAVVKIKYYSEFNEFGELYENIYITTVELAAPAHQGKSNMMGAPLKYQICVFDKYANILFKSFSPEVLD